MDNKKSKAKNWPAAPEGYHSSQSSCQGYTTQTPCTSAKCCNAPTICKLKSWETEYASQFKHGRINLTVENCLGKSECQRESSSSRSRSSSCGPCKLANQPGSSKRSVSPSISTESCAKRWKDNEGQSQYNFEEQILKDLLNSCYQFVVKSHLQNFTEENRLAKTDPLPILQHIISRIDGGNSDKSNAPGKSPTRRLAKPKRKNMSHPHQPNVGGESKAKRSSKESTSSDYILVKTTRIKTKGVVKSEAEEINADKTE